MSRKRQPVKQIEARSPWEYQREWAHGSVKILCVRSAGQPAWKVRGKVVNSALAAMDVAEGKDPEAESALRAECAALDRAHRQAARAAANPCF